MGKIKNLELSKKAINCLAVIHQRSVGSITYLELLNMSPSAFMEKFTDIEREILCTRGYGKGTAQEILAAFEIVNQIDTPSFEINKSLGYVSANLEAIVNGQNELKMLLKEILKKMDGVLSSQQYESTSPTEQKTSKLLTPKQVQEIFKISRPTFAAWCKSGALEKVKIPGARRVFVKEKDVDAIIESRNVKINGTKNFA